MLHTAAPAYTIQGKKSLIDKLNDGYEDCSPGPVYNTSGMGIKTRSVSFKTGKSERTKINQGVLNNPSPTHYQNAVKNEGISITMSKTKRIDEQSKNFNPEANLYRANENFIKTAYPNYSLGSRYPSIMDDTGCVPGPGWYQNGKEMITKSKKQKTTKFGSEKRFSQPLLKHPGVGDYLVNPQTKQFTSTKGTVPKANRFPKGPDYPGPDAYEIVSQFRKNDKDPKGKTLGARLQGCFTLQSQTRDSFANYFKDEKPDFRKTFSFGNQKREIFKALKHPGPGEYKPEKPKKKTPSATIAPGHYVEYDTSHENPGPGQYLDSQEKIITYSFGKSKSMKAINTNPGVGRYNMDKGMARAAEKSWSVGKGKRTNFISKNIAGVGDYEILQKKSGGISIPKASRFPKPNDNPGPGDYQFHSTISNFNFYKKRGKSTQPTQRKTD